MTSPDAYQELYQSMKSIYLHMDNGEKTLFSKFGLTSSRFFILKHIYNNPGINYIDLSELMLCTKGNVTRVIQGMLQENWVNRLENPEDRRSFQLFLSKTGTLKFKEVNSAYQDYITGLLSKLNEDQLRHLSEASSSIEKGLSPVLCC
jgi:DNA-binding MarR family transcriptional regulator